MRSVVAGLSAWMLAVTAAIAQCPGNPNALGTARTIVVDPAEHGRIGTMQYGETLPLQDKEVVLTFDDGPLPPYSNRILDMLAGQCVKATFFVVGRQVRAFPELVRRAYSDGHTIATHSENHPYHFDRLPLGRAIAEIDGGIASAAAALGNAGTVAPFFRVPGLRTSATTERYLASRSIGVWSADFPADDWHRISAKQVLQRALDRLERMGRGVLLLHDIQPATALALPDLLKALQARGYRIVHVVPAGPERPKTVTEPQQWVLKAGRKRVWPRVVETAAPPQLPVASPQSFGWPDVFQARHLVATKVVRLKLTRRPGYQTVRVVETDWPASFAGEPVIGSKAALPVPSLQSFGLPHPFGPHIALPPAAETPKSTVSVEASATLSSVGLP